jgi:hypothetical protein
MPATNADTTSSAVLAATVLRVLPGQRRYQMSMSAIQAFNMGVYGFIILLQLVSHSSWLFSWQALVWLPITLALRLWGSLQPIRKVRPFRVVVGEYGLWWRESRREKVPPWSELRGWCVVYLSPERPRGLSATLSWPDSIRSQPMTALYALLGEHEFDMVLPSQASVRSAG